jgi:hypothetical protein
MALVQSQQITDSGLGTKSSQAVVAFGGLHLWSPTLFTMEL